jgi:hypothetical protein
MVVVCAVVPTSRSAANTITSVQGVKAEQGRKSREKRGSGPTPCRSKDPLNMILYQYRYSVAAHEPSASNMLQSRSCSTQACVQCPSLKGTDWTH